VLQFGYEPNILTQIEFTSSFWLLVRFIDIR